MYSTDCCSSQFPSRFHLEICPQFRSNAKISDVTVVQKFYSVKKTRSCSSSYWNHSSFMFFLSTGGFCKRRSSINATVSNGNNNESRRLTINEKEKEKNISYGTNHTSKHRYWVTIFFSSFFRLFVKQIDRITLFQSERKEKTRSDQWSTWIHFDLRYRRSSRSIELFQLPNESH